MANKPNTKLFKENTEKLGLWSQLFGLFILSIALFVAYATFKVMDFEVAVALIAYIYAFINGIAGLLLLLAGTYVGGVKGTRTKLAINTILVISIIYILNIITIVTLYYAIKSNQYAPKKFAKSSYSFKSYLMIPMNIIGILLMLAITLFFIASLFKVI